MGGEGSGRKPSVETIVARNTPKQTPVGTGIFLPDFSGVPAHTKTRQAFLERDKNRVIYLHDDFIGTGTTTVFGETNWNRNAVVAGSANWSVGTATANHPGVVTLNSGTTTSTHTFNKGANMIELAGGESLVFMINLLVRDDPINLGDGYELMIGFSDTSNSFSPNDACAFYLPESDGSFYPNWHMLTASNGSVTSDDTGVATTTGWQLMRITLNDDATRAEFYINEVLVGTATANIPTGTGRNVGIYFVGRNSTYSSDTPIVTVDYVTFYKDIPAGRI